MRRCARRMPRCRPAAPRWPPARHGCAWRSTPPGWRIGTGMWPATASPARPGGKRSMAARPGRSAPRPRCSARCRPEDRERCAATILRAMGQHAGRRGIRRRRIPRPRPGRHGALARSQGRVTERDPLTGRALRAAGVTFDITRRREAETRYRVLFDSAPFTIIVIDPASYRILDVNAQASADYGYGRRNSSQLDHRRHRCAGRRRPSGNAAGRTGSAAAPRNSRRCTAPAAASCATCWCGCRASTSGSGRVTYGAHVDITARKAAEAELRRSEEKAAGGDEGRRPRHLGDRDGDRPGPLGCADGRDPRRRRRGLRGRRSTEVAACMHPEDRNHGQAALDEAAAARRRLCRPNPRPPPGWEERWLRSWGRMLPPGRADSPRSDRAEARGRIGLTAPRAGGRPGRACMAGVTADITDRKRARNARRCWCGRWTTAPRSPGGGPGGAAADAAARPGGLCQDGRGPGRGAGPGAHAAGGEPLDRAPTSAALLRAELAGLPAGRPGARRRTGQPGRGAPRVAVQGPALTSRRRRPRRSAWRCMSWPPIPRNTAPCRSRAAACCWAGAGGGRLPAAAALGGDRRPRPSGPPPATGFGTRVVEATLERQLGGTSGATGGAKACCWRPRCRWRISGRKSADRGRT